MQPLSCGRRADARRMTLPLGISPEGKASSHWREIGLKRPPMPPKCAGAATQPSPVRVLYVSGAPDITSHDYRVINYVEALGLQGIDAEWIPVADCDKRIHRLGEFSLIVFSRVSYVAPLSPFISAAERLRIPTVFDIDDYVFEPNIATEKFVDGIRFIPRGEIDAYHRGVRAYRTMILATQFATFPTKFLVDRGEELKRRSFLLPNGLDRHYLDAEPRAWPETTARVVIGTRQGPARTKKTLASPPPPSRACSLKTPMSSSALLAT
jgi:hypothetical protein